MFKRKLLVFTAVILSLVLVACGGSGAKDSDDSTGEETIVLKGLSAWDLNQDDSVGFRLFQEKIEEKSEGRVKVEHIGGPESIPAQNQGESVANGVADFSVLATGYMDEFPEGDALSYSELSPEEERENGAIDVLNSILEEKSINSVIVGRAYASYTNQYALYLRESVSSMEDLRGLKIRGSASYKPFFDALGVQFINMPAGERYSSMDRGVIDGFGGINVGVTDSGLHEVIGVKLYPTFNKANIINLMNKDTYEGLPEDIQQMVKDVMDEVIEDLMVISKEQVEAENAKLTEEGVEIITLDDGDDYMQLAVDSSWDYLLKLFPENGEKLEKVFRK